MQYVVKGENFIGVSQYGEHAIGVRISACKSMLSSWDDFFSGFIGTGICSYYGTTVWLTKHAVAMPQSGTSAWNYKRRIIVFPCHDGIAGNYNISYSRSGANGFRGHNCYNNYYFDGRNCVVGNPPAGTTAFVYNSRFYYTPINGNQCPLPNSWYDGANCYVNALLPLDNSPFIYSNKFYILPELIVGDQE